MKIDLSTLFEMIEQEDKNLSKTSAPVKQEKQKETALDLQGLFSLFEQLEPQISEASKDAEGGKISKVENLKDLNFNISYKPIPISDRLGSSDTKDYKYFATIVKSFVGGDQVTPENVFAKINSIQNRAESGQMSQSEAISSLILLDAFYSFFNAFAGLGGKAMGFLGESFVNGLYGADRVIPHGEATKKLFSVADIIDPVENVSISIKTRDKKTTGHLGNTFNMFHDVIRYGHMYFDTYAKTFGSKNGEEKSRYGIQKITFTRHKIDKSVLESVYGKYETYMEVVRRLEEIYTRNRTQQDPLQEMSFNPEPKIGGRPDNTLRSFGIKTSTMNDFHNRVYILSLYYSGQIENLKAYWQKLDTIAKNLKTGGNWWHTSKKDVLKEEDQIASINALRNKKVNLLGREATEGYNNLAYLGGLLSSIGREEEDGYDLYSKEELENIVKQEILYIIPQVSEQRDKVLSYVLKNLDMDKNFLQSIENQQLKQRMEKRIEQLSKIESDYPKIEDPVPNVNMAKPKEEPEADLPQEEEQIPIKPEESPEEKPQSSSVLDEVKTLRESSPLGNIPHNFLNGIEPEITSEITLTTERINQLGQEVNRRISIYYKMLAEKLNLFSQLMEKYFISDEKDKGPALIQAAEHMPILAKPAVSQNDKQEDS